MASLDDLEMVVMKSSSSSPQSSRPLFGSDAHKSTDQNLFTATRFPFQDDQVDLPSSAPDVARERGTNVREEESLVGSTEDDDQNSEDPQEDEEEPLPLSLPPEDEGEEDDDDEVSSEMKEERMTPSGVVVMDDPQMAPNVEVFELGGGESSEESLSPEDDAQALFIKVKEAQYKNAVAEAEIAKLKAKLILLENVESQRSVAEKRLDSTSSKLRDTEKALENTKKEILNMQDMLEESQGQYIALEKKYYKAKKLIKEYQQRERDFVAREEMHQTQTVELTQHYDGIVMRLKDRIIALEASKSSSPSNASDSVTPTNAEAVTSPIVASTTAPLPTTTATTSAAMPFQRPADVDLSEVSSVEDDEEIRRDLDDVDMEGIVDVTKTVKAQNENLVDAIKPR